MPTPTDKEVRDAASKAGVDVSEASAQDTGGDTGPAPSADNSEATDKKSKRSHRATGRPRGRPKKSDTPASEASILPGDQWETVTAGMLDMICEAWQIPHREKAQKKALATTSLAVIEKHLGPQKYAEEIALAVVGLSVFGPMMLERKAVAEFQQNQAAITEAARQGNEEAIKILEQMGAPLPEVVQGG